MRHRCARWLLALASLGSLGFRPAPVAWSPDGRWLAHTITVRRDLRVLKPGWIFETNPGPQSDQLGWGDPSDAAHAGLHRIWATRADTGASVLLEESIAPLTSPVWSPDGKGLAFGRLVAEGEGRVRFEVIVQDAPDRKRVLLKQAVADMNARAPELPGLSLAWGPDGRYLAVPSFQETQGLLIVRADNGRILKEIPDAYFPSWSPDGTKLAFIRGGERQSLHCLDTNFGPARHLDEIGQVVQAPVWSRDKRSVMVVVRRKGRPTLDSTGLVSVLLRMPIDGGNVQPVSLPAHPPDRDRPDLGSSFSLDPDGEHLYFTIDAQQRQSILTRFIPARGATLKGDNLVDFTVRISAVAVSPTGTTVAFRAGGPQYFAPPGFCDASMVRFTPVVSDDAARVQWIATLVAAARKLLVSGLPAPTNGAGRKIERATLLPVPGEMTENQPIAIRLRRLGRLGGAMCDRPTGSLPPVADVAELIGEARLFFAYLRGDHDAALHALEALEARTTSADHRLRLLSVRAQIYLARGQAESATRAISFLQDLEGKSPRRLEFTPAGPKLTVEDSPGLGWPKYLDTRAQEFVKNHQAGAEGLLGRRGIISALPHNPEAMPAAPGNFLELRQDDVPLLIGNGDVLPDELPRMPPRLDPPVRPRFRRVDPPRRER